MVDHGGRGLRSEALPVVGTEQLEGKLGALIPCHQPDVPDALPCATQCDGEDAEPVGCLTAQPLKQVGLSWASVLVDAAMGWNARVAFSPETMQYGDVVFFARPQSQTRRGDDGAIGGT